ncbi:MULTISPECIES: iron-sulfur cluster biosynthesis family protein [Enterococcus]|uniref:iron-sulfur cluster biosynthesis family protein n=1 Tax=Enterococcus TaxID=1350 RepID=UPI000A87F520|nr:MULTISPECIES: iron-sulfur cluster biosynthesis family protein [Enterococcus]
MKLTITPTAQAFLETKQEEKKSILLTLNDGSNQFSSAAGCCMIGDRFQLVLVDAPVSPFTQQLDNDRFSVFTSDYETVFLGENPILDFNQTLHTLILKNDGGLLDSNVFLTAS